VVSVVSTVVSSGGTGQEQRLEQFWNTAGSSMRHHVLMPRSETFAERLRRLREGAGLTQEELADRAGLSGKAVSLLERGERTRPYPHTVTALAEALGLSNEGRSALVASVPRGRSSLAVRPSTYVGTPPTPLLGRERELREVASLLRGGTTRLVTLTGPGGVGKTRLAHALLEVLSGDYSGGTAFVPLAPVTSPDLVPPTVVHALGLSDDGRDPREVLADHLTGRRMLLVLDNLEHLVAAVDDLAPLLALPDGPVFVATSRRPLRLRGEVEYSVPPLSVPESARPSAKAVLGSPAGRLFAQRAQAVSGGFEVTEDNAAEVAGICQQLAGIPLALEIAAARTRFLGTTQLLARLDRLMEEEGARDLADRQRTLARTLDWSHELLGPAEQAVFARLSVFAGSFGLDAAEVVGGRPDVDALSCLELLVEHSLVTADVPSGAGEARYRLLEPVRQYAAARLRDAGEEYAARRAHAQWYVALAEEAYPYLERGEQVGWLDLLRVENDNLRTAIAWSIGAGHLDLAVRFGWSLRMYWLHHDRREEGRLLLEQVPDRGAGLPVVQRAQLLHVLSFCHYGFGGLHLALSREALDLFRVAEDVVGEEYALGQLGFALLSEGAVDEAREALEAALALALARGDDTQAGHLLNHLAAASLRMDDRAGAAVLAERALGHARRTGEQLAQQTALQVLAQLAWADGDLERAQALFTGALRRALDLSDNVNAAYSLRGIAVSDGDEGGSDEAAQLFGAADAVLKAAGFPRFAWLMQEFEEAVAAASERSAASPELRASQDAGRVAGVELAQGWVARPSEADAS
jgi:predicted ATPase/transcriptional regulator with XRE-family HTH domain